ncbi:DUF4957 domain-containing protein [Maribellus sediminis]|uniref:DUF4957 domain-containing protein n=1 Tax=Maribellus sediminis TaxID=2696285 RepID=UPI001431921C|nr:DUF4957 domain-containing protein [Maribellus sediminis]
MRNSTFKILLMACMVIIAGFANGQAKPENYPTIGQSFVKDAETATAVFTIDFNTTVVPASSWTQVNDSTVEFDMKKARTGRGIAAWVYASDTAGAPTLNPNEDFKVRASGRFRSNENPNHVASVDSLQAILAKWEEVYAGTDKAGDNTLNNYSACVFDVDGDPNNQAYGVHPGIYKKLDNEFVFRWAGQVLTSDFEFDMWTYDPGNTDSTATYYLRVDFSDIDTTIENIYTTGSGLKHIKLAELTGLELSDFSNQSEVHIFIGTEGTNTEIAEGVYDPVVVFDNMTVSFAAPAWIEPAGGQDGGTFGNADAPFEGVIGENTMVSIPLKLKGRVAPMTITDKLYKNNTGDKMNKVLTFPDTLGIMANDGSGNYTVEVPYTFTPAAFDMGTQTWSEQKITIAAPEMAEDFDVMFSFEVLPQSKSYFSNIEIESTVRVTYQAHVVGNGSTIIDLTGVEDGYSLADTLSGVPDSAQVLLAPGKTYNVGGYSFDKSMVITSSNPDAADMPHIFSDSNFDMVENASVGYLVFRNLHVTGEFDSDYLINISKQSNIGDFVIESCKIKALRGIARIKDNPSTIENFMVSDCVMDSINNYGLLTMDKDGGAVNNIMITNSTFSRFVYFIVSRNNSNSLVIDHCTLFEVPEKGRQLLRYRGGDGKNNIFGGLSIQKSILGHGWNLSGEDDYGIKGKEGLVSTPISLKDVYATSDFAYSGDTIPGVPTHTFDVTSMDLWIAPTAGNFNFSDMDIANKKLGDPRWVYEDTTVYLLYAGAGTPEAMEPSDSLAVDYLTGAGYNVMYVDDNDLVAGYDYSSYQALVIGESCSSSRVVPFGKDDNYPIPLVSMEGFGVRDDKWGWISTRDYFQESRAAVQNMDMKILNNSHYITEELAMDQVVSLSTADPSGNIYAWGLALATDVPGAIALGQNTNSEITAPMMWAVPRGTLLGASGQVNMNRIVIFAANAKGLDASTSDFFMLLDRSIQWVLGAGTTVGIKPEIEFASDVVFYPNPAREMATLRFSMDRMDDVNLSVYNLVGQKMRVETPSFLPEGQHEIQIRTGEMNDGMYIYVLQIGDEVHKGKFNVMK